MTRTLSAEPVASASRRVYSPAIFVWVMIGLAVNFAGGDAAAVGVSIAGIAHSAIGFVSHGGRRISAPGAYMLGTGLFGFFSALYLIIIPIYGNLPYLIHAVNILYFGQLLTYYLSWKPTDVVAPPPSGVTDRRTTSWGKWVGFLLMAFGIGLNIRGTNDSLVDGAAFVGIILYAVAAFRDTSRRAVLPYLIVAAGVIGYATYVFEGFGRLNLGALGIAVIATVAHRWRGRLMKIGLVAVLGPALMYLAQDRVEFTATLNPNGAHRDTGMESVVGPMVRFSQLIGMDWAGELNHIWGSSFFTSAVALVPRQVWPDKPIGFGAELAMLFRPELAGTGHSEAALFAGEWLFNFGIIGAILSIPLIGYAVNWLDRKWIAMDALPMIERSHLLKAVALTILCAGLLDLTWGGSFTYAAREGTRLLIVLALFAVFGWRKREVERMKLPSPAYRNMIKRRQAERLRL